MTSTAPMIPDPLWKPESAAGIGTDWAMQGCAVAVATQSGLGGATGQGSAELGEQATVP